MQENLCIPTLFLRSLTPFEILKIMRSNPCGFKKSMGHSYGELWKEAVAKNTTDEAFKSYLEYFSITKEEFSALLSDLEWIDDEIELPSWFHLIEKAKDYAGAEIEVNPDYFDKPFYHVLRPFVNTYSELFIDELNNSAIPLPSLHVVKQLEDFIYEELYELSKDVLFKEYSAFKGDLSNSDLTEGKMDRFYSEFVESILSNQYELLFSTYPMLMRKLGTKLDSFIGFTAELFRRIEGDRDQLTQFFNKEIDNVSEVCLGRGDQHKGGSVVILEFSNGNKLVYKPASAGVTLAYHRFLDWVNAELGAGLKSFKALDKGDYSWLDYVENNPCQNKEEVHRYYERAGILACIAYFLNATDYHFENVIASGCSPVLIDHETIIGPILKTVGDDAKNIEKELSGSVLKTLLLPIKNPQVPYHVSGFGSSVELQSMGFRSKVENINTDSMQVIQEQVPKKLYKNNKPLLDGEVKNLDDYQLEFKRGFKRFYQLIEDKKEFLMSDESPIKHFSGVKIRYVQRPTKVYHRILKWLNKPEFLKDATIYGVKLEIISRAYSKLRSWSPILGEERDQLLSGDIPAFEIESTSDQLTLKDGQVVQAAIRLNALQTIQHRVNQASKDDLDHQMKLIEEVISL